MYLQPAHDCYSRYETLLDEHFRIAGRSKLYETIAEMHEDLGAYLVHYNEKQPHEGRLMEGRTPLTMFMRGLPKAKAASLDKTKQAA